MRQKPEEGIHDGHDGESETTLKIQFTNGNLLTGDATATTVSAKVLKGETDITSEYAASAFVWTREAGDTAADATWNAAHNGVKEFTVSASDLTENVKLTCTLTGTSPDYGTVYVDENMNLIHVPAEADANDTLHLENGILSVETEGNEYQLNDNVLGVIRHRLNGSVTAEAWVYTAAPEKLVEFKYDSNGLRTQKKVTDHGRTVTTEYALHSKLITHLRCDVDELYFAYDKDCKPEKVEYNGQIYIYIHNLQGDIVGILGNQGCMQVVYHYDAWGRLLRISGPLAESLGKMNPFRYRGYVYDESNLYYLRHRYYHPEMGRFVSKDSIIEKGKVFKSNLWAYCCNWPIRYTDANGMFMTDREGMEILMHWLGGSGETLICDSDSWGWYMRNCKETNDLACELIYDTYLECVSKPGEYVEKKTTVPVELEANGVSPCGYNYLHGTRTFHMSIRAKVNTDGTFEYSVDCEWEDEIDPNMNYKADKTWSNFARSIAQPKDYIIKVRWTLDTFNSYKILTNYLERKNEEYRRERNKQLGLR